MKTCQRSAFLAGCLSASTCHTIMPPYSGFYVHWTHFCRSFPHAEGTNLKTLREFYLINGPTKILHNQDLKLCFFITLTIYEPKRTKNHSKIQPKSTFCNLRMIQLHGHVARERERERERNEVNRPKTFQVEHQVAILMSKTWALLLQLCASLTNLSCATSGGNFLRNPGKVSPKIVKELPKATPRAPDHDCSQL